MTGCTRVHPVQREGRSTTPIGKTASSRCWSYQALVRLGDSTSGGAHHTAAVAEMQPALKMGGLLKVRSPERLRLIALGCSRREKCGRAPTYAASLMPCLVSIALRINRRVRSRKASLSARQLSRSTPTPK